MAVKFLSDIDVLGSHNLTIQDIPDLSSVYQVAGNYLDQTSADARYLRLSGGTLTGPLNILYNDHNSGSGWDSKLFIGTSDDLGLAGAFPTYVPSGSYGFFSHAYSDGVFIGSVPVSAGATNYYATIAWGDDATEYFQFLYKGTQVARLDTVGRFYAYGGNSEEWNAAHTYSQVGHLPLSGGTVTGMTIFEDGLRIGTGNHYTDGRASITFGEGSPTTDSMYIEYDGENLSGDNNAIVFGSSKEGVGDVFRVTYGGSVLIGSNQVATESYVTTAVSNLVDSAPGTLDTLNELAAALGDDANFSTTVTNSIATKLSKSGGQISRNGMLTVSPGSYSYANGASLELYTTDNHVPAIGFHRAGVSATTLWEEQGELFITKWNGDGTPYKLWHTGDFDPSSFLTSYTETDTLATVVARGQSTAQALVVTATDSGNPSAAANSARLSGYGLLGNRGTFYLTNGGGVVQIGIGSSHNDNPVATFGDSIVHHHPTVMEAAQINGETYIRSASNVGLRIQTTAQGTGGADGLRVGLNDTHAFVWQFENKPLAFATNGSQRMTISAGGNVGIGTTTPTSMLEVDGLHGTWMAHSYGMYFRNNSDTDHTRYIHARSNGSLSIGRGLTADLTGTAPNKYFTTDKDQIHITSGGNFGIGTTNPTTKLYVDGGESTFNRGNSDGAIARFRGKNTEKAVIGTVDSWFGSRVGIGTSSPTTQLQVGATSTNSISPVASLGGASAGILSALSLVNTEGNAAAGYGVAMDFHVNPGYSPTGRIATIAENTSTPAALAFYTYNGGLNKKMQISSNGNIRFHAYGAGILKTDANGNISLDTSTYATATDLQALETYANATFLQSVPSTFSATAITLSGIKLEESSDRPGILEINRDGSNAYAGIMTKFSGTAEWALMGDEGAFGLYDDQNNDWAWRYIENSELSLYHNGSAKIVTKSDGANVVGRLYATGAIQVPYAVGEHKPMVVLNGATNYGLFHTEASSDFFTFDFNGDQRFKFGQNGSLAFGTPGNGTNTGGAFASIEGNADTSGEGSGRLFFREHNSTTAAMDKYGMSFGYRGGSTAVTTAGGNTWNGLSQIGNGQWGMWGHDNSVDGALIMYGDRQGTYVNFAGNNITGVTDLYVADQIIHTGDTNTYMQFHAANQWRVVTGGVERFEVNSTDVTVQNDFKVAGSYTEVGNGIGSVSNDGGWNGRLNVAGTQHARLDVISVSDGIVTTTYSHTGQGMGKMGTISNHPLGLMTAGGQKVMLGTGGNMYPVTDRTQLLGLDTNRWQVVFCEILDSAGLHEKNLQNPEGEKSVGDYETGTVLVWKGGKNVPCTESADHMRMGIAVKGVSSPLVQGAEPVLCTGEVNEGDYLVTSSVEGHAAAISPQYMRQHNLFDCVLGKALEGGNGDSHIIKTWVNI